MLTTTTCSSVPGGINKGGSSYSSVLKSQRCSNNQHVEIRIRHDLHVYTCKCFIIVLMPDWTPGRQEDAHEFLVQVFEHLLSGLPAKTHRYLCNESMVQTPCKRLHCVMFNSYTELEKLTNVELTSTGKDVNFSEALFSTWSSCTCSDMHKVQDGIPQDGE